MKTKPVVKIDFSDFWPEFKKDDNFFYHLLSREYQLDMTKRPDFLIYSVFGNNYKNYDCIRIFCSGENCRPNFYECDYSFLSDFPSHNADRHFRLPYYVYDSDLTLLTRPKPDFKNLVAQKTKFCNMVVSNGNATERIDFFHKLSKYKKVDSGGKYLNNVGGPVADKQAFLKDYKFTIAFENSPFPGYTTEKIVHAMRAHSIPVYWGNPLVHRDFNAKSFVNCQDFSSFDDVIERVIRIDNDPELYRQYLDEPYLNNNHIHEDADLNNILKRFHVIFSQKKDITLARILQSRLYYRFQKHEDVLLKNEHRGVMSERTN